MRFGEGTLAWPHLQRQPIDETALYEPGVLFRMKLRAQCRRVWIVTRAILKIFWRVVAQWFTSALEISMAVRHVILSRHQLERLLVAWPQHPPRA